MIQECIECRCETDCIEGVCLECALKKYERGKKCFNWIKKLRAVCPYCVAVCDYDELIDKIKAEKGKTIKCKKCNKRFLLAG